MLALLVLVAALVGALAGCDFSPLVWIALGALVAAGVAADVAGHRRRRRRATGG
ncbi:hypothetical protein [Nocardioides sp. SYSU D00038]|uniref:hypothetical protein n=1 Tax=Nocardioides sp. SYSU D00038 TaxID=2812554 RepID=UPI001968859A|nr:hypothetical protein [Nocardioides sp. SYSU D00038]